MAHIKSHLGCSNSPWRNKKTTWSTGLSSPNFMSAPEKSTSNTKYIHHLHPFTTIFIYILLKKKDFSYAIAKNGKYMKMRNTHAIPKHNSTSTWKTQQLRRAIAKNTAPPAQTRTTWASPDLGFSRPIIKCNFIRPNQGKCCQTLQQNDSTESLDSKTQHEHINHNIL